MNTWLSVSEAALLWGTSARTVRRQCAAGQLPARRVGGLWQVEIESDKSANDRAAKSDAVANVKSDKSDTNAANNRPSRITKADKSATDLTEHLLAEVAFLRATAEQLQRDGAETRAALRAALKLTGVASAPMLEAGTEPPQAAQSAAANDVPGVTPERPTAPPTGAAGSNSQQAATGAQRLVKRAEATATGETDWNNVFANLADQLDGKMNQ